MEVKKYIEDNILVFDGAMGTMLQNKGLKLGEHPDVLNITEKEKQDMAKRNFLLIRMLLAMPRQI